MSSERIPKLRLFVSQLFNSALEEILSAVDKMIDKYEQEAALNQQVISRQHALLCALQRPIRDLPSADSFTQNQNQNQNPKERDPPQVPGDQERNHLQDLDLDEDEIIRFTYNRRSAARPEPAPAPAPGPGPGPGQNQVLARADPGPGPAGLDEEVLVVSSGTDDSEDWTEIRSAPDQQRSHRPGPWSGFRSRSKCRTKTKETQTRTPKKNQTRTHGRPVHTTRVQQRQTGLTCEDCGRSLIPLRRRRRHRCRPRTWTQDRPDPGPPRTRARTKKT